MFEVTKNTFNPQHINYKKLSHLLETAHGLDLDHYIYINMYMYICRCIYIYTVFVGSEPFSLSTFNLRTAIWVTAITFEKDSSHTPALLLPLWSSRASDRLISLSVRISTFLTCDNFKRRQEHIKLYINRLPHSTTIAKQAYTQTQ
jgi:hypothetical protein